SLRMSLAFALAWLISSPMLPVVSNRNITSTTVLVGRVLTVTVLRTVVLSPTPSSAEKEVGAMASAYAGSVVIVNAAAAANCVTSRIRTSHDMWILHQRANAWEQALCQSLPGDQSA